MNKIVYLTFILFCLAVSSKCNVISEETINLPTSSSPEREVEEKCLEETVDTSYQCDKNIFNLQFIQAIADNSTQADFLRSMCEKHEDYYTCLSIGLDAYTQCLSPEEIVGLSKIRKVFRRVILQICEADIEKIVEFLNGDESHCYKNNLDNILLTVTSIFSARRIDHLPSSYFNDKTCGNLTKLHQELKPVLDVCENKSPGIFLQNLISAIQNEIFCQSVNLTPGN